MIVQYNRTLSLSERVSSSQFVGRQRELELIWNQYEAARSGSARIVLMVGELGIGKTRLLDEVATRTIQDGAIVLRGSASESEGMPPYLPFLEALGRYIRTTPLNELHKQISPLFNKPRSSGFFALMKPSFPS